MARVVATTGMGRWPFDRLVRALEPVSQRHDLFAQVGPGDSRPPYPHVRHMAPSDLHRRLADADVVITHAGNTVRLVQRMGKVPIVVAREAARGEMGNDHQVRFVRHEATRSPMIVLSGSLDDLPEVVDRFAAEASTLSGRPVPEASSPGEVARALVPIVSDRPDSNPTWTDPTRRNSWAYAQLAHLDGPHLDIGCGRGELLDALTRHAGRSAVGVDAEAAKLEDASSGEARSTVRGRVVQVASRSPLPFRDGSFASVSMLDVLEHVWNEDAVLSEAHRVLRPGGTIVVTVPRQHLFTFLDPGNARFRFPGLHRRLYSLRHGARRYDERFVEVADGMRGDTAVERLEHHNYENAELTATLERNGFAVTALDAANLFWRFADIPRSILPDRWQHLTEPALRVDSHSFHRANLFLKAVKR